MAPRRSASLSISSRREPNVELDPSRFWTPRKVWLQRRSPSTDALPSARAPWPGVSEMSMVGSIGLAVASMLAAWFLTPCVRRLALRLGAVDEPGERKVHTEPMPRLGGLAIFGAFGSCVWLAVLYHEWTGRFVAPSAETLEALIFGGAVIVGIGFVDDRYSLPPRVKLAAQILAASLVTVFGLTVQVFQMPFVGTISLGVLAIPFTVAWIVCITNALNLVDGMDGLGAGVAFIASTTSWLISLYLGDLETAMLFGALSGASLGFLRHNLPPARIFLGDSGSLFLGFALSVLSIQGSHKAAITVSVLVPLLILGFPILDVAFAIVRRTARVRSERRQGLLRAFVEAAFRADREHIHHRLLWWGLSHRQAVVLLYGACASFGALAFVAVVLSDRGVALILAYVGLACAFAFRKLSFGQRGGAGIRGAELCGRIRRAAGGRSALLQLADPSAAAVILDALEGLELRWTVTHTGEEACRVSRSRPFEIVLFDIERRRDEEMTTFERLKDLNRGAVFIALSGFEGPERTAQALRRGAYDVLQQPLHPDRVRHVVNRACERIWLLSRARFSSGLLWLGALALPVLFFLAASLVGTP